jgi:hypothetical protein
VRASVSPETFWMQTPLFPVLTNAVVCGAAAVFFAAIAWHANDGGAKAWTASAILVVAGPGFAAYRVTLAGIRTVEVHPQYGIVLSDGRSFAWRDIVKAEFVPGPFYRGDVYDETQDLARVFPRYRVRSHFSLIGYVFAVIVPTFSLLTPMRPRVVVHVLGGRIVALPDLLGGARLAEIVNRACCGGAAMTHPRRTDEAI